MLNEEGKEKERIRKKLFIWKIRPWELRLMRWERGPCMENSESGDRKS